MIQRIQSVYMLLAIVAATLLFVFPYAYALGEAGHPIMAADNLTLLIPSLVLVLINLLTIFLYKNRKLQMRLNRLSVLLALTIAGFMLYEYFLGEDYNIRAIQLGQYVPALVILFNLLALSGIKKDEKLVRSMDRLR